MSDMERQVWFFIFATTAGISTVFSFYGVAVFTSLCALQNLVRNP